LAAAAGLLVIAGSIYIAKGPRATVFPAVPPGQLFAMRGGSAAAVNILMDALQAQAESTFGKDAVRVRLVQSLPPTNAVADDPLVGEILKDRRVRYVLLIAPEGDECARIVLFSAELRGVAGSQILTNNTAGNTENLVGQIARFFKRAGRDL